MLHAGLLALGVAAFAVAPASAQDMNAVRVANTAAAAFDVPAGALDAAIVRFGRQSGLQFSVSSKLTNGKRTAGIKGRYSTEDALRALLAGSGLTFRYTGPRTVVIEALPDTGDARVLGPLRIEGADTGMTASGTNGVNGSTDITATEGAHSYTSGALTVGTKAAASMKNTVQSVSVMTRKQIEDQNLTDVYQVMKQAPGLSMVTGDSPSAPEFYSRGFKIEKFQIDGGAPINMRANRNTGQGLSQAQPVFDTALYDHVEVLRGADGLFNGYGNPGGIVNLTRKRPLDHSQLIVEGQLGSWNNARVMLDASDPLGFGGKLRGRAVLAKQDRGFFYRTADSARTTLYGVLEADLSASTVVSLGASWSKLQEAPWRIGLPRYEDGGDLGLPRDTCLCLPWADYRTNSIETFARVEQALSEDWSLKANLTRMAQKSSSFMPYINGTVKLVTRDGPAMGVNEGMNSSRQTAVDATLAGTTHWFGQTQEFVFGANYVVGSGDYISYDGVIPWSRRPSVDVFAFNPHDPRYVRPSRTSPGRIESMGAGHRQLGVYANFRLTFFDRLHFSTGMRYSEYSFDTGLRKGYLGSGNVYSTSLPIRRETRDTSWPPASYNVSWDWSNTVTAYVGYTDIYQPQVELVDESLSMIAPITGSNVEAGLKFSLRDGRLNASLSAYRLVQHNLPKWLGPGKYGATGGQVDDVRICCYVNDLDREYFSQGLDLELSGELLPDLQVLASYTWNNNENRGKGFSASQKGMPLVSLAPRHLLKLWADYRFNQPGWLSRLSLGAGVNTRTSAYRSGSACTEWSEDGNGKVSCSGYTPFAFTQGFNAVFAARAAYDFNKVWNASLNVDNIGDRRYYQTPGSSDGYNWYGEPRSYMLSLRGKF